MDDHDPRGQGATPPSRTPAESLRVDAYVIFGATGATDMESEQHGERGLAEALAYAEVG